MSKQARNRVCSVTACVALVMAMGLGAAPLPGHAAQPVGSSRLYYQLGGGSPANFSLNRLSTSQSLGLSGALKFNYSCGKFDIGMSWAALMNSLENLGSTITGAVQAGISSLPLYVLQRAHPGLYQLFQNFSQKADLLVAASLKSCEGMEEMIRNGQNPYEDWVKLAKGESWRIHAQAEGDVVQAKYSIDKNESAQKRGITWVTGGLAGGDSTPPIEPIKDLTVAGYNATLNQSITASATHDYSGHATLGAQRLVRAFKTPESLSKFTMDVVGDSSIKLSQGQPTSTRTAIGLGPKIDEELKAVQPRLVELVQGSNAVSFAELEEVSAPGMGVSPALMEAMRGMPPDAQTIALGRLSEEIAMHRIVNKALIARNVLITGLTLPEAQAASEATRETQIRIDRLTKYIDDLMYEFRIRKEMTSDTAMVILQYQQERDALSQDVPGSQANDPDPLIDGRVKPPAAP